MEDARVGHSEGPGARFCAIARHGTAAALLGVALAAWPWGSFASLALGLPFAAAAAHEALRGLGLPRWMTWSVATIVTVALISHAVGGLAPITGAMERIGVGIGRRLSFLRSSPCC